MLVWVITLPCWIEAMGGIVAKVWLKWNTPRVGKYHKLIKILKRNSNNSPIDGSGAIIRQERVYRESGWFWECLQVRPDADTFELLWTSVLWDVACIEMDLKLMIRGRRLRPALLPPILRFSCNNFDAILNANADTPVSNDATVFISASWQ